MNLLITGSSGHLGEALGRILSEAGHQVRGIDLKAGKFTHAQGSIVDAAFVRSQMEGIDAVLHTATLHKPHVVTHSYQDFINTNISGTKNLLEAAVAHGIKAFLYTSTTSAFGASLRPGATEPAVWVTEALPGRPKNIYGLTKTSAEDLCQLFHRKHGLPCLVLRTSRFFLEADDQASLRDAYPDLNLKANEMLYRRVDIADIVTAHIAALERAATIGFGTYIISATTPFSQVDCTGLRRDAPSELRRYFPEYEALYAERNWQMFPSLDRVYDNAKARRELDWKPQYDFQYVLDCLRENRDFFSLLAREIGIKGYHDETFAEGPYPVE